MRINKDTQKKIFSSLIATLRTSELLDTVRIIKNSENELINTRYDNWNQGTWFYTLCIYLKLNDFNQLTDEQRTFHENIINQSYSKLFNEEQDILECVVIKPLIEHQIDWAALKGIENKRTILEKLEKEKEILINVGTGVFRIQDIDDDYILLHKEIESILNILLLDHPLKYNSLWEWYTFYSSNLSTYRDRRKFINDKYSEIINIINDSNDTKNGMSFYKLTGWEKIDNSIAQLNYQLNNASDRIDLNQIGLRCRETITLLANEVYIDELHHPTSFPDKVSSADSSKMLEGYIEYHFKGSSNDEKRKYAKTTNNLVNNLTHKKTATLLDAKLSLSATISLINIIKIINDELSN